MNVAEGCRARIWRARELLEGLKNALQHYLMQEPFLPFPEKSFDGTEVIIKIREQILSAESLVNFALRAGEIAHHLRSALDNLAHGLVLSADGRPNSVTAFPIVRDSTKFREAARKKMPKVAGEPLEIVRRVQPFHDAVPQSSPLSILQQLNNSDKHQLLPLMNMSGGWLNVRFSDGTMRVHPLQGAALADGVELARFPAPPGDIRVVESWFFPTVVFAQLPESTLVPMVPTFIPMLDLVERVVEDLQKHVR
jgi:hypothetical protein